MTLEANLARVPKSVSEGRIGQLVYALVHGEIDLVRVGDLSWGLGNIDVSVADSPQLAVD